MKLPPCAANNQAINLVASAWVQSIIVSESLKPTAPCPCGLPATLGQCCGRYHAGAAAPTAEALMRSRYSAYVLGLNDYLLATWHPSTRPGVLDLDDSPRWLGLSVKPALPHRDSLRSQNNSANAALAERATVEFVARYKIAGRAYKLHETSRFVREDGRWYYLNGEVEQ